MSLLRVHLHLEILVESFHLHELCVWTFSYDSLYTKIDTYITLQEIVKGLLNY